MSRLISLFFQGSLVKRIAVGLVLGILVALITPMLQPTLGFNLAEKVGVLGQIFVRSLRAVAPLLIFVLVMASCIFPFIVASLLKVDPKFGKKDA